jgi:capsular polysaccharide biosynthesis protein
MQSNLTLSEILSKIQRKFNTVIIITLVFVLVGVGITLIIPKQYRGESQLVVIQTANPEIDSYTAQRSIDSKVDLLVNLVYTDTFFTSVVADNVDIKNTFPENLKKRRIAFARNIIVKSKGTGFISVETYDSSSELALTMNKVVIDKLMEQAKVLLGETGNIQVVNQSSLYDGVGRPDILVNLLGSALLGFAIAIGYVIARRDQNISYDFGVDIVSPQLPNDTELAQNPIIGLTTPPTISPDTEYDSNKF